MNLKNLVLLSVCVGINLSGMEKEPISLFGEDYWKIVFGTSDSNRLKKNDLNEQMKVFIAKMEFSGGEELRVLADQLYTIPDLTGGIPQGTMNVRETANGIIDWLCGDANFEEGRGNRPEFKFARLFLAIEIAKTQIYTDSSDLNCKNFDGNIKNFLQDGNDDVKMVIVLSMIQNSMHLCFRDEQRKRGNEENKILASGGLLQKLYSDLGNDTKKKLNLDVRTGYKVLGDLSEEIVDHKCADSFKAPNLLLLARFASEQKEVQQKQGRPLWQKLGLIGIGVGALSALAYYLLIYKRSSSAK